MISRTWLYKIRAWIDRRVPRDVLVIEIRHDGKLLIHTDHMQEIFRVTCEDYREYSFIDGEGKSWVLSFTKRHLKY